MTPRMGTPATAGVFRTLRHMPRNQAITIRVSEETAQAIDALRGGESRSQWVGSLVDAALESSEQPKPGKTAPIGSCSHPRARVIKGFCYRCGSMVIK